MVKSTAADLGEGVIASEPPGGSRPAPRRCFCRKSVAKRSVAAQFAFAPRRLSPAVLRRQRHSAGGAPGLHLGERGRARSIS